MIRVRRNSLVARTSIDKGRTMKASVLGLFIAVLTFAGSTIYLSLQLREERAQADKLALATRDLNARIAQLEKARAEPRFAIAGSFGFGTTGPGSTSMVPPAASAEKADTVPDVAPSMAMNQQPPSEAFAKMLRSQARANNKRLYADVGVSLGLSKIQADKLVDLITDQETAGFTLAYGDTDAGKRSRLVGESRQNNRAEIIDLIGADKMRALEDYQETIPARQEVEMMSRQLEGSASGLDEDQQKRMLAVLIEERKRVPIPRFYEDAKPEEYAKVQTAWQDDYSERVSAQARGILNPEQLAAYNEYQEWQKEIRSQMATIRPTRAVPGGGASMSFTNAVPVSVAADSVMLVPDDPAEMPRKAK